MSVPHDRDRDRVPVPRDFDEVEHGGDDADALCAVRELIRGHVAAIVALVHYGDVVPAGRQWTIPVGLDCGFDGELVVRVQASSTCGHAPEAMIARAIAFATRCGRGR